MIILFCAASPMFHVSLGPHGHTTSNTDSQDLQQGSGTHWQTFVIAGLLALGCLSITTTTATSCVLVCLAASSLSCSCICCFYRSTSCLCTMAGRDTQSHCSKYKLGNGRVLTPCSHKLGGRVEGSPFSPSLRCCLHGPSDGPRGIQLCPPSCWPTEVTSFTSTLGLASLLSHFIS